MANDVNCVIEVGRLTRNVEIKTTQQGTTLASFSIAVGKKRKTQQGTLEEVSYFDVSLWGKMAEALRPYLVKGQQVCIVGELQQQRWEKDGNKYSKVVIVANNVQLLGSQNAQGQAQGQPQAKTPVQQSFEDAFTGGPENFDEGDIPF